jgi:hypothetical protein
MSPAAGQRHPWGGDDSGRLSITFLTVPGFSAFPINILFRIFRPSRY